MSDLVTIHEVKPKAKDAMNGKEGECVVCSFGDGSFQRVQISWNSLKQLVKLKSQNGSEKK